MAKEKKVTEITDMEVDFAQWFTDVCKKAQLIDYSSIKGVLFTVPMAMPFGRISSTSWIRNSRSRVLRMCTCLC